MVRYNALVKKALRSQPTLDKRSEHCSADRQKLASVGAHVGHQIRVERNETEYALYTVSEVRDEVRDDVVRMAAVGRARLRGANEFEAVVDTQVARSSLTDQEAEDASEFVERFNDDGQSTQLIVLAPHGGAIEPHTDEQAERVHDQVASFDVSSWRCKGWKDGGGAYERWHITSTEINECSFPLLKTIIGREFAHAVAFHGFENDHILIGGSAPPSLKRDIKAAIERATAHSGICVRIAEPDDGFNGDDPRNVVNRLCQTNGVQIEQPLRARRDFGQMIANEIASVYEHIL